MSFSIPQPDDTADEQAKRELLERFTDPVENTRQALESAGSPDARRHSDADSIRRHFGIPEWDPEKFDYDTVLPNCLETYWDDSPEDQLDGGSDLLVRGKPGSGKSTLANYLSARELEINDAAVVWRGSTSRSEWLPLAPWTRLCLPKGTDPEIRLDAKNPSEPSVTISVDELEEIVREVVRYRDPVDLNHRVLQQGAFHVVYPDPSMRNCQAIYEESDERTVDPPQRGELFDEEDPANHWWFAWMLARVEHGPFHFTAWICDELGDIMPQGAQKDQFGSYQKVELAKDVWVDLRKMGVSFYGFLHTESDAHEKIRRKLRWRCQMPTTANPTGASGVVGFDRVPMETDITSRRSVGTALMYTETNFELFKWKNMPRATNHNLKIKLG